MAVARAAQVTSALEEAVDDLVQGRAREGILEAVVVGEGGRVNEGGENGVDVGLIRGVGWVVFELGTA